MRYLFNHIDEKDIDLLLADRLSSSEALLELFKTVVGEASNVNLAGYELEEIQHSAISRNGESDIELLLSNGSNRFALLVEDKVDAPAQPAQARRYLERGREGIASGRYDAFATIIVAPQGYLDSDEEAKGYQAKISYQDIRDTLSGDEYANALLSCAIQKEIGAARRSYSEEFTRLHEAVWSAAEQMNIHAAPKHRSGQKHGENSWVTFSCPLRYVTIRWSADRGVVSLDFEGWSKNRVHLQELVGPLPEGARWRGEDNTKSEYIEIDALHPVKDWQSAAEDKILIVDALYKVERLWQLAQGMANRPIDWLIERDKER